MKTPTSLNGIFLGDDMRGFLPLSALIEKAVDCILRRGLPEYAGIIGSRWPL